MPEEIPGPTPPEVSLDEVVVTHIVGEECALDRAALFAGELRGFFANRDQMRRPTAQADSRTTPQRHLPLGRSPTMPILTLDRQWFCEKSGISALSLTGNVVWCYRATAGRRC